MALVLGVVQLMAVAGCAMSEPVLAGEAVEVVLQELEIRSRPDDLVVELQTEPAHRFDAERVWSVSSRAEGFGGWVDADTGEILDIIITETSGGQI